MNWLELMGAISIGYIISSAVIAFCVLLAGLLADREGMLKIKGWYWKVPLFFIFLVITWPLMLCQMAEMTLDNNGKMW